LKGLVCHTGNRLEVLAERLAWILRTPLTSPLHKEIVVVQSLGMERWVRMELARHHGICANFKFSFPNAVLQEIFQKALRPAPCESYYEPEVLRWRIMNRLPSLIEDPAFEEVRIYLGERRSSNKSFQLSERLANLFDQYLLYRPDMIRRWENGEENHWQARLWRDLAKEMDVPHRARLREEFLNRVRNRSLEAEELPERISLFGISTLPPFHMEVFAGLSEIIEVNLFLMNPCRHYWADIVSGREREWITGKGGGDEESLHLEEGNPLLASMGTQGRDFFSLVNSLDADWEECFEEESPHNLLTFTQADLLDLRNRGEDLSHERERISLTDPSIQVHSCHSVMREMETLRDRVLAFFEEDPHLLPRDILVMAPDIEIYAPYIHAVFSSGEGESQIPYTISDRNLHRENSIFSTFQALLEIHGGRFGSLEILSLLDCPPVRAKFRISESDLPLLHDWVAEAGIRWGTRGQDKKEMGLPPLQENTWEAGLNRLLLGYALPGGGERLFKEILPYDPVEGTDSVLLGRFTEFVESLFSQVRLFSEPRRLDDWSRTLAAALNRFFLPDEETERQLQTLRMGIVRLSSQETLSGYHEPVELEVIKNLLARDLEQKGGSPGFLTGGITFCALLPMRSIPFKVICLVGMDDESYPRQTARLGFDLMGKNPRPGDRNRREDDRYLFLEAILSARKALYISYVGQSARDNSPIPPSVLVSELLDYLMQAFETPGPEISTHLVTRHRLQPFNPLYFRKGSRLFSYSEQACRSAGQLLGPNRSPAFFIPKGLTPPPQEERSVDLARLCKFYAGPAGFLLRERLGIAFQRDRGPLDEHELFTLDGLSLYQVEQMLLEKRLEGWPLQELFPLVRASGRIPHGSVGECIYEEIIGSVERFTDLLQAGRSDPLPPLDVRVQLSGVTLTARLESLFTGGLVGYRYARLRQKDHLAAWCRHLLLNAFGPADFPRKSVLYGKGETWVYGPVERGEEILARLLDRFLEGLVKPLPFFPESSFAYASSLLEKGKTPGEALQEAGKCWTGNDFHRGECQEESYRVCFDEVDPLDTEFAALAVEIFEPILASRRKGNMGISRDPGVRHE
jgi:exodeoxyribonuclease V gamma subunit